MDLLTHQGRAEILTEIKGEENKKRKLESLRQNEIYNDRIRPYVLAHLRGLYSEQTIKEMPVVSSINLSKRVVNQEASVYKDAPERSLINATDEQKEVIDAVYEDMQANAKLAKANRFYKLQNQTQLMVVPRDGKLVLRVLKGHHYDVITDPNDPEKALAYVVSSFEKEHRGDGVNQKIADKDDSKLKAERHLVWTREHNFIMNGKGEIIAEEGDEDGGIHPNPIGELPFIDVAPDKDFEFFVDGESAVTDFCIQFNAAWTDLMHVMRMQGFAVAYYKGAADLIPESLQIGPNYVLKIPIDPNNPVQNTEFGYASPSPDLAGSLEVVTSLLSTFLSSKGVDPKTIAGRGEGQSFTSALERLLSLIEKFEASKSDLAVFRTVEYRLFELVKKWLNVLRDSDLLEEKYKTSILGDDVFMTVNFKRPEMVRTEGEVLDTQEKKGRLKLASRIDNLMEIYGLDREGAIEKARQIDEDDREFASTAPKKEAPPFTAADIVEEEEEQEEATE